jgi:hypothetical protein
MSGSIRLSPKHGINPSLAVCFFCQKDRGDIILPGLMKGDTEAPRRAVWDKVPCDECKGYMSQGIIFISVDARLSTDQDNPYRSGGWCVLTEDAVKRMLKPGDMRKSILKSRVAFIPDEVWDSIGLPR